MPSCPKNYPFYNWVPKPLGILILLLLFIPILTASGVYTVNSGEMLSGLGIQSEHIQFVGFLTSVGMAAFYNPQIQISAESETKRSIFREKDKTKRSKKESAQHSKSRNKSFVMTSVSAL